MNKVIIEIKARCCDPKRIREILRSQNARYVGKDHQVDTYFRVSKGRLKLREGKIENNLIYYDRENIKGPKKSSVTLFNTEPASPLKTILQKALGVFVVVDKQREIYFIDNVKFHIDDVKNLGSFVEIEAIGDKESADEKELLKKCKDFLKLFNISGDDLIAKSYSDMLTEDS